MATRHEDKTHRLIQRMTKAERRFFTVFTRATGGTNDTKTLKLFGILNQMPEYDKQQLQQKAVKQQIKGQVSRLKHYLYRQILRSLDAQYARHGFLEELGFMVRSCETLMRKNLYDDALDLANKALEKALEAEDLESQIKLLGIKQTLLNRLGHTAREVFNEQMPARLDTCFHELKVLSLLNTERGNYLHQVKTHYDNRQKVKAISRATRTRIDGLYLNTPVKSIRTKLQYLELLTLLEANLLHDRDMLRHAEALYNLWDEHKQLKAIYIDDFFSMMNTCAQVLVRSKMADIALPMVQRFQQEVEAAKLDTGEKLYYNVSFGLSELYLYINSGDAKNGQKKVAAFQQLLQKNALGHEQQFDIDLALLEFYYRTGQWERCQDGVNKLLGYKEVFREKKRMLIIYLIQIIINIELDNKLYADNLLQLLKKRLKKEEKQEKALSSALKHLSKIVKGDTVQSHAGPLLGLAENYPEIYYTRIFKWWVEAAQPETPAL